MDIAIGAKGQVTIPKAIREHLGLKPGDRVKIFLYDNHGVTLLPTLPATALRGMLKARRHPVTLAEMNEGVAIGTAKGTRRRKR